MTKRVDRKTKSDDHALTHAKSNVKEPVTVAELKQYVHNARADRTEAQKDRDEFKKQAEKEAIAHQSTLTLYQAAQNEYQTVEKQYKSTLTLYIEAQRKGQSTIEELTKSNTQAQSYRTMYESEKVRGDEFTQKYKSTLTLYQTVETKYKLTLALYVEEQRKRKATIEKLQKATTQGQSYFELHQDSETQAQSYRTMYESEKVRGDELTIQFNDVQGYRDRYLTLYNESQVELKTERRSKAGVKGWETRRKKENEKLKQEISEMAMVLRDSMERKDEAINSLYAVAERMDRIQRMVDSVDDDTATNPIGMVQKLQRMWQAVKLILAE